MTAKRTTAKKTAKKKTVAKKAVAKKGTGKQSTAKKSGSKKAAVKKTAPGRATAVKAVTKKATSKQAVAKASPRKMVKKAPTAKKPKAPKVKLNFRKFRDQLRQKHQELMQAYLNAKGDTRQSGSDGTEDYIDYAVNSYDREFLLSLTELEQSQLDLIEEALTRIDDRTYGDCVQCERPIPVKRLEVQPWARYCLACQELADQGYAYGSSGIPDGDDFDSHDGDGEEPDRDA